MSSIYRNYRLLTTYFRERTAVGLVTRLSGTIIGYVDEPYEELSIFPNKMLSGWSATSVRATFDAAVFDMMTFHDHIASRKGEHHAAWDLYVDYNAMCDRAFEDEKRLQKYAGVMPLVATLHQPIDLMRPEGKLALSVRDGIIHAYGKNGRQCPDLVDIAGAGINVSSWGDLIMYVTYHEYNQATGKRISRIRKDDRESTQNLFIHKYDDEPDVLLARSVRTTIHAAVVDVSAFHRVATTPGLKSIELWQHYGDDPEDDQIIELCEPGTGYGRLVARISDNGVAIYG